ncbi:hypothetical protein PAAG_12233 [Paracoccidioides lutzii Pb01]|uniref:Uncharacterized protein n=1 Tax=Paracoccidioides lutzii (strain ATCC MYA-826 / Pb01) TaxID=502779 RepID=A0A0A2V4P7_PARBA|nr:hypothetical protein PAAG_12233 [Paracoccidioides lutzii Pb01]KGQ01105.1 hypothetical protein PAAG_12233 [Paracoccidioides lutzii Pb01]
MTAVGAFSSRDLWTLQGPHMQIIRPMECFATGCDAILDEKGCIHLLRVVSATDCQIRGSKV